MGFKDSSSGIEVLKVFRSFCIQLCPALRGAEAVRDALIRFLQLFSPPEGFRWRFPVRQKSIAGGGGQAGGWSVDSCF